MTEILDAAAIGGQTVDLPCDWRECEGVAAWIVWTTHTCARHRGHGLLCDDCLRRILLGRRGLVCRISGEHFRPARRWLRRFERLDKPPAGHPGRDH